MRPKPRRRGRVGIILSCPADFEHRLRLNRAAHQAGIPFLDAAQWGMAGSLLVSNGRSTPCLACAYPELPPFETYFPVVGAIAGTMGNLAAWRRSNPKRNRTANVGRDARRRRLPGDSRRIQLSKRPGCPVCNPALAGHGSEDQHLIVLDQHPRRVIPHRPQMLTGNRQHGLGDDPVRVGRVALIAQSGERIVDRRAGR